MTFETEIAKRSSYRDALVRISVRRNYTSLLSQIVVGESDHYWFGALPPGPVEAVYRNGVALTKHAISAGEDITEDVLSDDEYAVTKTTSSSTLWLKIADDPSSETNVIVVVYTLHYGSDKVRTFWDPEDDATELVRWEPRLLNDPEVGTYFDNILAGVLSIADTTIEIADADNVFKDVLTSNDSFRSARVVVWGIVNGTGNVRKIYTGETMGIQRKEGVVSLSVVDVTLLLRQPAYMGDTVDEAIFTKTGFPSLDPNKIGRACPFVTGESSRHRTKAAGGSGVLIRTLDPEDTNEAVCIDFAAPSVNDNRVWALCRVPGSVHLNTFTSLTRVAHIALGYFAVYANGPDARYKVGDSFQWKHSGTNYSAVVFYTETFIYNGQQYNLLVGDGLDGSLSTQPGNGDLTTSSTPIEAPAVAVLFNFGDDPMEQNVHLRCDRDFVVSITATSGGNSLLKITLADNFEAHPFVRLLDGAPTLNPQQHRLFYRVTSDSPMGHGALLQRICDEAGLAVDSSTFDQADSDLAVQTYMQIPSSREDDYEEYLKYAELICKSTLGFLAANAEGEMIYQLISAPEGGDALDENTAALQGYSVDYNDIVTGLIGINQDLASEDEVLEESAEAEHLHNVKRVVPFYHVLKDISGRLPDILGIMRKRKAIYTHTAPHVALSREIGDEATIDHDEVMGGDGSANVIITGIRKTMDETTIESTDLGGG